MLRNVKVDYTFLGAHTKQGGTASAELCTPYKKAAASRDALVAR
jgi:hypothetical protein